jgi:arylsulfatase A
MLRFILTLSVVLFALSGSVLFAKERPNVILILADDFGYECVRANGGESYNTPNLDQLAKTGIRFTSCHVQPLCTPTRVQLMTGKSNIRNYLNFGKLIRSEQTFAHRFKEAGYTTGICGKWQLGQEVDAPQHFGFDEACLWQHTRRPPRYANPGLEYNGREKDFSNGEYGPDLVQQFALDFISRHKEKPFFLYYPMMLTHSPYQPTPDSVNWDPTAIGEKVKDNKKHFGDMVQYMDKLIGNLVVHLESQRLRDNTLILFVGDNGTGRGLDSRFEGRNYPGGKGTTTQRGTHVPMIANWPAVITTPAVNNDLISSVDFLPTLCEVAQTATPQGLDGISFYPQLTGKPSSPREWIYSWYSPRQGNDKTIREFAFDHRFKLYRNGNYFDLEKDVEEKRPLSESELTVDAKQTKERLQKALDQYAGARPSELE